MTPHIVTLRSVHIMKIKLPSIKRCAFAAVLLSITSLSAGVDDFEENTASFAHEELIAQDDSLFADTLLDFGAEDLLNMDSHLVAKKTGTKKSKLSKKQANLDLANANNTWTPRFVWLGDVDNSENLKCFAAFLIGSLDGKDQGSSFDPGVVFSPNGSKADLKAHLKADARNNVASYNPRGNPPAGRKSPPRPKFSVEIDAGPSFLVFEKYKGNLVATPQGFFPITSAGVSNYPVKGKPRWNTTPLYEMSAVYNFLKWLGFGFYMQNSQNISFSTKPWKSALNSGTGLTGTGFFESNLSLNALGGKLMFNFPNLIRMKRYALGVYAGGGAGVAYQTWTNSKGYQQYDATTGDANLRTQVLTWRTRYFYNFGYNADAGLSLHSREPISRTLLKVGCKFVGWGATGQLGDATSSDNVWSYWQPVSLGGIFSIVPYMGFNWSF